MRTARGTNKGYVTVCTSALRIASQVKERFELASAVRCDVTNTRPHDWMKWEVGQKVWPSDFLEEGDLIDVHGPSERGNTG